MNGLSVDSALPGFLPAAEVFVSPGRRLARSLPQIPEHRTGSRASEPFLRCAGLCADCPAHLADAAGQRRRRRDRNGSSSDAVANCDSVALG